MTVKYLIVESNLQNAELCARELFQKGLISKRAEWRWIPFGKELFLRMYVERLTT